ncbi:tRNA1(Val) (adenine(37)-N6)-methyltransferase [Helicobacter cappadocius]|uniref:Methyltransferase n=1 Tax=Helicobacter cappadocius TaxID=3063998 RepID=A0AA90T8Z3_9HELI|nr:MULTISPECIES: methyltransferase [unclassified Helicobacter]MDO7252445.1 methyltransferase [Helicobacter sp. faydin-H75]MDP2538312.1 methyltransferase [Helicobacter sp. faydin-H76]
MDKKILKLYQLYDGYCYNSDSLFLYDFAREFIKKSSCVLEVGSGSGVVGLLCARAFDIDLTMIEIDVYMAFLSKINAASAKIQAKIICKNFLDFHSEKKFDMIISNPPFYRLGIIGAKNRRIKIARSEEFLPFREFCTRVKRLLKSQGSFVFCYDAKESHRVFHILKDLGFNPEVTKFVHPRIDKEASLLLCKARINTKSSIKILPPLITHYSNSQLDNTDEVKKIYQDTNTYSIKVHSKDISLEEKEDIL